MKKIERPKLSPKEIERTIQRLQKKLRTINQKIKNNKKKKRNLQQKQVKSKLEKELDEIRGTKPKKFKITELASALRGFARQFRIEGIPRHAPREFLQKLKTEVLKLMRENRRTRVRMILNCEMRREELFSEEVQILNSFFHSGTAENLEATDETEVFDTFVQAIEERIQNFNQRGSNWRFQTVLSLDIHFTDFIPLRGSTFFPLPQKIADKKVVINVENDDDQCFMWSVTRSLHPVEKNARLITKKLKKRSKKIGLEWTDIPGGIEPDCNI